MADLLPAVRCGEFVVAHALPALPPIFMLTGRGIEFVSESRSWIILPRSALSAADREQAISPAAATRQLDRWCADPATRPKMLAFFESMTGGSLRPPAVGDVEARVKPALRHALAHGAWAVLRGRVERHAASAKPVLQIVSPAKNTVFVMDDSPRIPAIELIAKLEQGLLDVTSKTQFTWSAEVRHNPRTMGDAHGPNREFVIAANGRALGGRFSIVFSDLMAGQLQITLRASVNDRAVSATTAGLSIVARNPTRAAVQAEIGDDVLQRIACHESGQRQFRCNPGDTARAPLWSGDNLGGVGLFQITVPRPTHGQVWNWRENVAAGRGRLEQGRRAAGNYPRQIRHSHTLAGMLSQLNSERRARGRPALKEIVIPELSPAQVEDDAIRAFNGYGGHHDQFGFALHEFRLKMTGSRLDLLTDEARLIATASWERVPVSERGRSGDPNYVNNVRAANPSCGG